MIWSIDRDTITEDRRDGFAGWTYRYTLDPDQVPKTIDLTSLNTGADACMASTSSRATP